MAGEIEIGFSWDWVVAYRSARRAAGEARLRYRVTAAPCPISPTGWAWGYDPLPQPDCPCPKCGSETEMSPDCPTHPALVLGGWQRCSPPSSCGDAANWRCARKGCDWTYAFGYDWRNPNNAHLFETRGERPEWMRGDGE